MLEPILTASMTYGITMGSYKRRFARTLGVDRFALGFAFGQGMLGFFVAWVAYGWIQILVIAVAYSWIYGGLGLSWQMHRSYPLDTRYWDLYVERNGRI